ncbi:MAG: recombinase family protein, partial [Bacilli bacterium]|nr:recombinase family protein [Bacilli bacterium]
IDLYLQGNSQLKVLDWLNKNYTGTRTFQKRTIETMLHNELYTGYKYVTNPEDKYSKILVKCVDPIISMETWKQLESQYEKNRRYYKRTRTYMFLQKIKCPKCGRIMSCTSGKSAHGEQRYNYYRCPCSKPRISISEINLETHFLKELNQMLDFFMEKPISYFPVKGNATPTDKEEMFINQKQKLDEKKSKVIELYIEGTLTKYKHDLKLAEINNDVDKINEGLELIRRKDIKIKESFDITKYSYDIQNEKLREISYIVKVEKLWNQLSLEAKQELIMDFIDSKKSKFIQEQIPLHQNRLK